MNLISKKDLLALTGISYGQLYRWKREGLIPEEWFIKQSSYTGQETFLPREQALSRVRSILEMKDSHSLDELAAILSPSPKKEVSEIPIGVIEELRLGLPQAIETQFGKGAFSFLELTTILSLASVCTSLDTESLIPLIAEGLAADIESTDYTCCVFTCGDSPHVIFVKGGNKIILPPAFTLISEFHLGTSGDLVSRKYMK